MFSAILKSNGHFGWFRTCAANPYPVALTCHRDDLGVVQEAVQDSGGRWYVSEQLAAILQRSIGRHNGGTSFITTHHNPKQKLAASFRLLAQWWEIVLVPMRS